MWPASVSSSICLFLNVKPEKTYNLLVILKDKGAAATLCKVLEKFGR